MAHLLRWAAKLCIDLRAPLFSGARGDQDSRHVLVATDMQGPDPNSRTKESIIARLNFPRSCQNYEPSLDVQSSEPIAGSSYVQIFLILPASLLLLGFWPFGHSVAGCYTFRRQKNSLKKPKQSKKADIATRQAGTHKHSTTSIQYQSHGARGDTRVADASNSRFPCSRIRSPQPQK